MQHFQKDQLRDEDQEWHRLVSQGALEALGKKEVHRQSVMFEIIKGERDYVNDLQLVQQVRCKCRCSRLDALWNLSSSLLMAFEMLTH